MAITHGAHASVACAVQAEQGKTALFSLKLKNLILIAVIKNGELCPPHF